MISSMLLYGWGYTRALYSEKCIAERAVHASCAAATGVLAPDGKCSIAALAAAADVPLLFSFQRDTFPTSHR